MSGQIYTFNTTAARLAYVWTKNEKMCFADDLENGRTYLVRTAGTGADCMVPIAERYGYIDFPLNMFREVSSDGDVGDIAAIGGVLASDTTPIARATTGIPELVWAASNNDIIQQDHPVPGDFDGTRDCSVMLRTASGGTTNAASFTVDTYWDGGTAVSDTATGAASTAEGDAIATVAAADIPDAPRHVVVRLTPTAHTTDTKHLRLAQVRYLRK